MVLQITKSQSVFQWHLGYFGKFMLAYVIALHRVNLTTHMVEK